MNIEIGDYLVSLEERVIEMGGKGLDIFIDKGSKLPVTAINDDKVWVSIASNKVCYGRKFAEENFTIEKPTIINADTWEPKQNDWVLVRQEQSLEWRKRMYALLFDGKHYCYSKNSLTHWRFIKPYEKPIPYLSEIEELIKKSNSESDFSVITYNVERKC